MGGVQLTCATFLTDLARFENFRVDRVSRYEMDIAVTVATIVVFEFPPSESCVPGGGHGRAYWASELERRAGNIYHVVNYAERVARQKYGCPASASGRTCSKRVSFESR